MSPGRAAVGGLVGVVAVVLAVARGSTVGAADDADPCAAPDALAAAGELALARREYLELLEEDPGPSCARAGFDEVARRQRTALDELQRGRDREDRGDDEGARAAYLAALATDPSLAEARAAVDEVLAESGDDVDDPLAVPRALRDAGFTAEAKAAVVKAIEAGELDDDVIADLDGQDLDAEALDGSQAGRLTRAADWLIEAGPRVGALLAGVVLAFALLRRALIWVVRRATASRGDGPVGAVAWWLRSQPLRSAFDPQLRLDVIDDGGGDAGRGAFARATIAVELDHAAGGGVDLQRVTDGDAGLDLATVVTGPGPGAGWAWAGTLLTWILARPQLKVCGQVVGAADDTVVLSVDVIDRRGRIVACRAFVENVVAAAGATPTKEEEARDVVEALRLCATDAAAWLVYTVGNDLRRQRHQRPLALMGATSWRSYALLRRGIRLDQAREAGASRQLYLRALREDRGNYGALVNLGALDRRTPGSYGRAIERLDEALDMIEDAVAGAADDEDQDDGVPPWPVLTTPSWYPATYSLAVTRLHRHLAEPRAATAQEDLDEARTHALRLVRATARVLRNPERRPVDRAFCTGVAAAEPEAVSLLAGIEAVLAMQGTPPPPAPSVVRGGAEVSLVDCDEQRWRALDRTTGASLRVLLAIVQGWATRSYGARYNLACTYAHLGKVDRALAELERALEVGGDLVDWAAEQDPALSGLRRESGFEEVIRRSRPAVADPPSVDAVTHVVFTS